MDAGLEMNLFDLVHRKDCWLQLNGKLTTHFETCTIDKQLHQYIQMEADSELILKDAHLLKEFAERRSAPGWQLIKGTDGVSCSEVSIQIRHGDSTKYCLWNSKNGRSVIFFRWPTDKPDTFDLVIRNYSNSSIRIDTATVSSYKDKLIAGCKGLGVEVGPGLNPHIKNSEETRVKYIEKKPPPSWKETYNVKTIIATENIAKYTVYADGMDLPEIAGGNLDFVYSNHVLEHLLNPLRFINDSLAALSRGGVFLGSVPSCENTFDLRQTPSTLSDLVKLDKLQLSETPDWMLERWINYTEPRTSLESLRKRDYSIHITFWTVELIASICTHFIRLGLVDNFALSHTRNNKDIQFLITSTGDGSMRHS